MHDDFTPPSTPLTDLERACQPRRPNRPPVDVERIVEAVSQRIAAPLAASQRLPGTRRLPGSRVGALRPERRWFPWGVFSAAAVLLVMTGLGVWPGVESHPPSLRATTYATRAGERATVTLRDGTRVTLGPATTITATDRLVMVQGAALFAVTPRDRSAFIVQARGTTARVLGTEFGVRAYDTTVTIAVRTGKVAVGKTILATHDMVTVCNHIVTMTHSAPVEDALAFAEGKLVLTDVPLQNAVADLNRWFDADLRVAPALATKPITITFTSAQRSALLEFLTIALHAQVTQNQHVITVVPR